MKHIKKYCLLFILIASFSKAQVGCVPNLSPTVVFSPNTTSSPTVGGIQYLCGPNTIVYDTAATYLECQKVFVNANTHLILTVPCSAVHEVWIKSGGSLTIPTGVFAISLTMEPGAIVSNSLVAAAAATCSSITFPNVLCNPTFIHERSNSLHKKTWTCIQNPNEKQIEILINEDTNLNYTLQIRDLTGRTVQEITFNSRAKIPTLEYKPGIYYLNLKLGVEVIGALKIFIEP